MQASSILRFFQANLRFYAATFFTCVKAATEKAMSACWLFSLSVCRSATSGVNTTHTHTSSGGYFNNSPAQMPRWPPLLLPLPTCTRKIGQTDKPFDSNAREKLWNWRKKHLDCYETWEDDNKNSVLQFLTNVTNTRRKSAMIILKKTNKANTYKSRAGHE